MIIIFENKNNNTFLKSQLTISNMKFTECLDFEDLAKKKNR